MFVGRKWSVHDSSISLTAKRKAKSLELIPAKRMSRNLGSLAWRQQSVALDAASRYEMFKYILKWIKMD